MGDDYVEAQYYCVGDMNYITADSVHQAVLDWFEGFKRICEAVRSGEYE